ncbi:hypothetical protein LLT7_01410 [Lactococcus cremoris subsp. cremoris TIFN7]|nr:hypothetical protein LLT7_01410 [Lactococcus cremoris subsp. cremoris TIFN7]
MIKFANYFPFYNYDIGIISHFFPNLKHLSLILDYLGRLAGLIENNSFSLSLITGDIRVNLPKV